MVFHLGFACWPFGAWVKSRTEEGKMDRNEKKKNHQRKWNSLKFTILSFGRQKNGGGNAIKMTTARKMVSILPLPHSRPEYKKTRTEPISENSLHVTRF